MNLPLPMRMAQEQSLLSSHKIKVGAALVKRGKILSVAYNISKTHPKYGSGFHSSLHAEGHALYMAIKNKSNVKGSDMYVFRRFGNMSKPCPCCEKILRRAGVRRVFFSYKDGGKIRVGSIII